MNLLDDINKTYSYIAECLFCSEPEACKQHRFFQHHAYRQSLSFFTDLKHTVFHVSREGATRFNSGRSLSSATSVKNSSNRNHA